MEDWVLRDEPHDMTMNQLALFLKHSEEAGYTFNAIISGGEPLLWPHIIDGLAAIRSSRSVAQVVFYSNAKESASKVDIVARCARFIDILRMTQFRDNADGVRRLSDAATKANRKIKIKIVPKYHHYNGCTVGIGRYTGKNICTGPAFAFWGDRVTLCPLAPVINRKLGSDPDAPWQTAVINDYLRALPGPREKQPACSVCIQSKSAVEAIPPRDNPRGIQ